MSPEKLRLHEKSAHTTPTQPSASRKRPLQHGAGGVGMKSAFELVEDSLNGSAQTHRLRFATERPENYVSDLGTAVLKLAHELIERLTRDANVKWYLSLSLVFHKATHTDVITDPPVYFRTEPMASTSAQPIALQLKIALRRLWQEIDSYEENGSGWIVDHLRELDLHVVSYDPLRVGIYLPLPQWLVRRQAVLNIRNLNDDDW